MAFTRAQYRTRILRRMDATGSSRWDTTAGSAGEVDQVLGFLFDREWRRILNANPFYQTNAIQATSDTNGAYPISSLTTGSGDTKKRFYRVIGIILNSAAYEEVTKKNYLLAPSLNLGYRVWFRDGDNIYCLPIEQNKTMVSPEAIHVNWIPERPDNLAADGSTVSFPDGYEEILCLEAAAFLLAKGGAETDTSAEFRQMAESLRQEMLADIQRFSINPMRTLYPDSPYDWAG